LFSYSSKKCKKRNKYLIKTYSLYDTEDDFSEDTIVEEEIGGTYSEQFLSEWEKYWQEEGEKILWSTWTEKYKEYFNPQFDLIDRIKTMELYSDSEEENETVSKDEDEAKSKRKVDNLQAEERAETQQDEKWNAVWEDHCKEVYSDEFQKRAKNHSKKMKFDNNDAKHNPALKKYWSQRYALFSKFDQGIKLDYGK